MPWTRNIVLVGHDIQNEQRTLKHIGIDLRASIIGFIDTAKLSGSKKKSLAAILDDLGISFWKIMLHVGANDAHLTLKALLLLVVKAFEDVVEKDDCLGAMLRGMEVISQASVSGI